MKKVTIEFEKIWEEKAKVECSHNPNTKIWHFDLFLIKDNQAWLHKASWASATDFRYKTHLHQYVEKMVFDIVTRNLILK